MSGGQTATSPVQCLKVLLIASQFATTMMNVVVFTQNQSQDSVDIGSVALCKRLVSIKVEIAISKKILQVFAFFDFHFIFGESSFLDLLPCLVIMKIISQGC